MNSGVLRMSGELYVGLRVRGTRRRDTGFPAIAIECLVSKGTNRADTGLMLRV